MTRSLVRPPVATDRVHATTDGRVLIETPPDPGTGVTTLVLAGDVVSAEGRALVRRVR